VVAVGQAKKARSIRQSEAGDVLQILFQRSQVFGRRFAIIFAVGPHHETSKGLHVGCLQLFEFQNFHLEATSAKVIKIDAAIFLCII
jgi:hypothetical protein